MFQGKTKAEACKARIKTKQIFFYKAERNPTHFGSGFIANQKYKSLDVFPPVLLRCHGTASQRDDRKGEIFTNIIIFLKRS